jgi:15-cis-phytoene synthase
MDKPRDRSIEEIAMELEILEEEIHRAYEYGESEHPSISAFIVSAKKFNIPKHYALDLIKGVMMDKNLKRYDDFNHLYLFCYRVAAVVGLMMTYVLGFNKPETLEYAEKLGIAMQLTNILRDVSEDARMGRIYIPKVELQSFGVSEEDILQGNFTKNVQELIKFQVDRAYRYYSEAEPGIKLLHKESQFAIYSASRIYSGILKKLKERDYNPFLGRVFVPKSQKMQILVSEYLKRKFLYLNA